MNCRARERKRTHSCRDELGKVAQYAYAIAPYGLNALRMIGVVVARGDGRRGNVGEADADLDVALGQIIVPARSRGAGRDQLGQHAECPNVERGAVARNLLEALMVETMRWVSLRSTHPTRYVSYDRRDEGQNQPSHSFHVRLLGRYG